MSAKQSTPRVSTPLAERIQQRLDELGTSAYAISLKASDGKSKDLINNIFTGRAANPRVDTLQRLSEALEVTVEWLLHGDAATEIPALQGSPTPNARPALPREALQHQPSRMSKNLPVLGTAAGSLGGAFQFEGGIIEYVARPPGLLHVPDAYALYVEGDSMSPAHPNGVLRVAHPHKPPRIGDTVVVVAKYSEHEPEQAFIKELVKRSGDKIIVKQYNPPAQIEFTRQYVRLCHKILELDELLGF